MTRFPHGITTFGNVPVLPGDVTTGSIFFVHSGGGKDGYLGTDPAEPLATLAAALAKCTAAKNDRIYVMPGHAETVATAIAINVAGVEIVGLGNGDNRPTFTLTGQVPAFSVSADDIKIANLRFYSATAGSSYLQNLMRIAANDVSVIGCEFKTAQKMYHTLRIVSGDKVRIQDCVFLHTYAPGAGAAGIKAQNCILNIGGTNALVKGCRFNDVSADKAHRWKAVIEGGKLTASLDVEDCDFVCRGIATRTRSAGASGFMSTKYCRGISPSGNTAVGGLFLATYQYILETYNVAAVNKIGVIAVTTASDRRLKFAIEYL
jgi:hypothetical protein